MAPASWMTPCSWSLARAASAASLNRSANPTRPSGYGSAWGNSHVGGRKSSLSRALDAPPARGRGIRGEGGILTAGDETARSAGRSTRRQRAVGEFGERSHVTVVAGTQAERIDVH